MKNKEYRSLQVAPILAIGLTIVPFILIGASIIFSLYGLYLAFSASILLGIVAFFVEPSPLVFGAVMFFFGKNIPEAIMMWLNS